MSCLVVVSGQEKGRTCKITPDHDVVIGRVADCDVCLLDQRASRRHCVVVAGQAGYLVRDLGSANGTRLNGQRIKEAPLKDGDKLVVGITEFEFHQEERFEDAETKKLAGGGHLPAEAAVSMPRRTPVPRDDTQAIEFCARCSGSVPATAVKAGRARRDGDAVVCAECLASEKARAEAARVGQPPNAAEEIARLAAEALASSPRPPSREAGGEVIELDNDGLPRLPDEPKPRITLGESDRTPMPNAGAKGSR